MRASEFESTGTAKKMPPLKMSGDIFVYYSDKRQESLFEEL